MKTKTMMKSGFYLFVFIAMAMSACKDSFLQPKPKSFHTPSNTLTNRSGFEAVLLHNRKMLAEQRVSGTYNPITVRQYIFSDLGVNGQPRFDLQHNMVTDVTPTTSDKYAGGKGLVGAWSTAYDGINNANLIISNIDNKNISWKTEDEKKVVRAEAYFHRSYWYYYLVNEYGDVPLVTKVVKEAKLDFYTYSREAILKKIRNDMEFAVQWLPIDVAPGKENRAAGYYLLTKIYLQLRQFKNAASAASQVIDGGGYALMTRRFGSGRYANEPGFNVLWDMFEKENISSEDNTEVILAAQSQIATEGSVGPSNMMYNVAPSWWKPLIKDPSGGRGTVDGPEGNPISDSLGRGNGNMRPSPYYEYTIWQDNPKDLRHSDANWFFKEEYRYNNPSSDYYGQPFDKKTMVNVVGSDTISSWYEYPSNKAFVPDETREHRKRGGYTDWYVYRLAGLYLLRAEAYYWMGEMSKAADDINKVRERAQASAVSAGDVSIDYIFDERARELFLESPRKVELTRAAYILAQLGRNGYSLKNMNEKNWYYDRVMKTNKFFREQITYGGTYKMSPYHVYWPIPQDEIDANQFGHINQSKGYPGAEDNIEPRDLSDLEQDGTKKNSN